MRTQSELIGHFRIRYLPVLLRVVTRDIDAGLRKVMDIEFGLRQVRFEEALSVMDDRMTIKHSRG